MLPGVRVISQGRWYVRVTACIDPGVEQLASTHPNPSILVIANPYTQKESANQRPTFPC